MSKPRSLTICLALLCLLAISDAFLTTPLELQRLCNQRTGLTSRDFGDKRTRNEGCSVDCITKQGTIMTAYARDGQDCHDSDGYRCFLGKCRSPDDKLDEESRADLNTVDIGIKSAYVADRDPYPGQGESDAFVIVESVSGGEPSFRDGDLVCHTHVIQDNSRPRWNFSCKPLPMKSAAKLKFSVYDSDKPDTSPQLLGTTIQTLDALMNAGSQELTLEQPDLVGGPYLLEVEVRGKRYTADK